MTEQSVMWRVQSSALRRGGWKHEMTFRMRGNAHAFARDLRRRDWTLRVRTIRVEAES
jgi:hypothetical protein